MASKKKAIKSRRPGYNRSTTSKKKAKRNGHSAKYAALIVILMQNAPDGYW